MRKEPDRPEYRVLWYDEGGMLGAPLEARISVVTRSTASVGIVARAGFVPRFAFVNQPVLALFKVGSVASRFVAAHANGRGAA